MSDDKFLRFYEEELQHVRDMSGDFAKEYPKIAGRLGLDSFECADPYVERLLEGFAFTTARIQMKMDEQHPRFIESLLEVLLPHYLAPTPAMMIAKFSPDLEDGDLESGFSLPRGTRLRSDLKRMAHTPCIFKTSQDVTLWPIKITEIEYHSQDLERNRIPAGLKAKSALRIQLEIEGDMTFADLEGLDHLDFYLNARNDGERLLFKQLFTDTCRQVLVQESSFHVRWQKAIKTNISPLGLGKEEALLPVDARTFQGYRLLQEEFVFPEKFMFFRLGGLREALETCSDGKINIFIPFKVHELQIEKSVDLASIELNCSPAINLFEKETDRFLLNNKKFEHHVLVDRTRLLDYEVHSIQKLKAYGKRSGEEFEFLPMYSSRNSLESDSAHKAYFTSRRKIRNLTTHEQKIGKRSTYMGTDSFVSLVDANEAPYKSELNEICLETLCSNRDLPLLLQANMQDLSFSMDISAPVKEVECLGRMSAPKLAKVNNGNLNWQAVSHLSKSYESILSESPEQAAEILRGILSLYIDSNSPQQVRQLEGIRKVSSEAVVRRLKAKGQVSFVRGVSISVMVDETAFKGASSFLLGVILNRFFKKFASVNSFIETSLETTENMVIKTWPIEIGSHQVL